jgi:hypothetical protein
MVYTGAYGRSKTRYWIIIIFLAVLGHFILLLSVRPSFFGIFKKSAIDAEMASSASSAFPNAIIVIPLDEEGEETRPIEIIEPNRNLAETPDKDVRDPNDSPFNSDDITRLVNDPQATRPGSPTTPSAVIPPKPVEITWPETKKLRHCLGLRITVRIRVDEKGGIVRVDPIRGDLPANCTAAALRAARRIVFLPGKINGKPAAMWTTIQIDFREPSR